MVLDFYVAEYLHVKYPKLPLQPLKDAVDVYTSPESMAMLCSNLGLAKLVQYDPKSVCVDFFLYDLVLFCSPLFV